MKQKSGKTAANLSIEGNVIHLTKTLTISNTHLFLHEFEKILRKERARDLMLDLSDLEYIDSAGATAIHSISKTAKQYNVSLNISHASEEIQNQLDLFKPVENKTTRHPKKESFLLRIGERTAYFLSEYVATFIFLVSDVLYWSVRDIFYNKQRRKGESVNQAVNIGVNAVPIIISLVFIIGLVMALQSASQLRNFGANIFIVDLTVIAMMAEMGPLITAILVAGRSGSAIAAEIATMKVTSEIDALQTMGINPLRFVVVPKIYGSLITMPFLTILASVAGIIGGATAAYLYLDITPEMFFNRIPEALYQKDIITSLIKSLVFAMIIVITGTFFGFKVEKGAEDVGNSATKAVVAAITLVIIADSILGLIFY
ncbi:MAG: MlaE family lipid ABC transporter permease subunit [Marinilabiliaceae bacterium]